MEDAFFAFMIFGSLFVALPWLVLHYVTKWKSAATLPVEDEKLLDELYDLARRLEDRVYTVERIVSADNPDWRPAIRDARDGHEGRDLRDERDQRDDDRRLTYRSERSN
jgi:phage shock protein B